jgi:hypothetical protein
VKALEFGSVEVEGVVLDAVTDLESKLEFSKSGDEWESISKADGSLVVAIDCTQDEAIVSAGMSRELINAIQQLRKAAGLDLSDIVEVFYAEEESASTIENAVNGNAHIFDAKFKTGSPVPRRYAPHWTVVLKSETVQIGGTSVTVSICRPALVAPGISEVAQKVLATLEPANIDKGQVLSFTVDGKSVTLAEGEDFWLSASSMVRSLSSN